MYVFLYWLIFQVFKSHSIYDTAIIIARISTPSYYVIKKHQPYLV